MILRLSDGLELDDSRRRQADALLTPLVPLHATIFGDLESMSRRWTIAITGAEIPSKSCAQGRSHPFNPMPYRCSSASPGPRHPYRLDRPSRPAISRPCS